MATEIERRNMLLPMVEAVYIDVSAKKVMGVRPKPAFLPLFNLSDLSGRARLFWPQSLYLLLFAVAASRRTAGRVETPTSEK